MKRAAIKFNKTKKGKYDTRRRLLEVISRENCEARWYILQSGLLDEDEINSLTEEGGKRTIRKRTYYFWILFGSASDI